MNILFVGDIVGKGGRKAAVRLIPQLREKYGVDFCIANAENIAAGSGLAEKCVRELFPAVDAVTSGDHVWDQKKWEQEIELFDNVLRPANLHEAQPGSGIGIFTAAGGGKIAVINLLGKVFMKESAYCPFMTVDKLLTDLDAHVKHIVVDFHAEATSEKIAMGYYLDGRVTAVIGTHTHVPTGDARILKNQSAFVCDAGMTGGDYSVLGREVEAVLDKFTSGMPRRLPVVEKGLMRMDCVLVSADVSGKADNIESMSITTEI